MRARPLAACVASLVTAATACDALYGIRELPGEGTSPAADGATGDAASEESVTEAGGADGSQVREGGSGLDGQCGPQSDAGGGVDRDWAQWAMPNAPLDVEAGAPHPQRYTLNGDGTVTDQVTGLTWQQDLPSANVDGPSAPGKCAQQRTAGYCDWRLPSYVELQSIVDFSQTGPTIDPTAFPGAPTYTLWTSSLVEGSTVNGWAIAFTNGASSQELLANPHHLRCVRGGDASDAGSPPERYTVASGTVLDVATGLTWQQATSSGQITWSAAQTYCATLSLDGSGWRLPTISELVTLVDVTQVSPAIDGTVFPAAQAKVYWSATAQAGTSGYAWGLQFYAGNTNPFPTTMPSYARCVR